MLRFRKALSVLLIITFVFSINMVSIAYSGLSSIFSVRASAIDSVITGYAPSGTRNLAVDASVSASSSYTSGDGHWDLARINDGSFTYSGGENGYNGEAAYSSSPDEIYYHPDNMTQAEKDTAVAESKTKQLTIDFDLEGFYDVNRVTLFHIASFPDTFDIQTSTDGVNYNTVATKSGYAGFNQTALSVDFSTTRARFVRILVRVRGNLEGNYIHLVQFKEIAVFGKEVAPTNSGLEINTYAPENCINLAIDGKFTVSESYEEGNKWGVHKINDGDTSRNGTGYTSESGNRNMFIDCNLGNIAEIKRIVYFPCGGVSPKTFAIQTSFDGVTYTTVSTHTTSTNYAPGPLVYDLPETTFGSYVRLYITERYASDGYYVQMAELAIYGIKNAYDAQPSKSKVKLTPADTLQLSLDVKNLNSFDPYRHNVVWSSSNTSVATVSSTGLITAKAVGETTIRIENTTIGYYAEIKVNVYTTMPFARDEMTVSIFAPPLGNLFTDEQYQRLAAADVDLVLNTYNVYTKEDNLALISMTEKYGMNAIVADMRLRTDTPNLSQEVISEVYADYKGFSNLEGFYVYDEPWNANIYKNTVNTLESVYPGSFQYLNFFPAFAYTSLEQYEYILSDWAVLTNGNSELMFDVYPFMQDGSTNYNRLFDSLDVVRRVGLKYDVDTAGCIQAIGYGPVGGPLTNRVPYESDIRYQNMAYLAYGVKHVSYWKYSAEEANGQEEYSECPIDENGNPTNVYYYMQRINPVVHTLGKTLINCDAKEVYITGSNTFGQKAVPSEFFVQSANSSQSLIFSYLQDKTTGRNYLMVVNNDLSNSVTASLKFANGINNVEILNNDTGAWTSATVSGNYNVSLLPGGAALIALPSSYRYAGTTFVDTSATSETYHKTVTGDSSLGTPGVRDEALAGWYLNALTDGYVLSNTSKGINGWCSERSASSFSTYVQIDLGEIRSVSSVTLHAVDEMTGYTGYFPKSYTMSVSTNGTFWTSVASVSNSTTTDEVTHTFTAKNARYIRVNINDMNAIDGLYAAALSEIEINGAPRISDFTLIAEDVNGYYVYSRAENINYVRVPSWTELNGQDDLGEWYESEKGSWTIDGRNYNFRAYVPVSKHNNEHGTYISHIYGYKDASIYTAVAATFNFDLKLSYDLNYGNIPKNLANNLDNITGGSGVTATYNASDDTVTLNGTLSNSINLQYAEPLAVKLNKGDTLRVIFEQISGSTTNGLIVLELYTSTLANPDGRRHVADITGSGVYDIPVTTDKAAKDITTYKLWLYQENKTVTFNNYKFRIKLEVYNGTAPTYSPSGKTLAYMELAGTLPTPTRSDADFLGWFTHENVQVFPDTPNTITNSLTLYAHWSLHPINISYDKNIPSGATPTEATNMPSTGKLTHNTAFTLPTNIPQMTGYIFKGWATTANVVAGETVYQPGATISADTVNTFFNSVSGAKLYARWTPITYKVVFRGNGNNGGTDVSSHTMTYDVETRLNLNTYTKTGYTFKGWNLTSDGSSDSFVDGQVVKNLAYNNGTEVILYAQWSVNKYTIIFNGNGHTGGSMSNLEMSYDIPKNLTANGFIKNGAAFVCWNTKADGSGTSYSDGQSVSKLSEINADTVTLYAIWSSYSEVIFGNEFDFDRFYYSTYVLSGSGYSEQRTDCVIQNKVNNTLTITATEKATDSYTSPYKKASNGTYAMNLIPGRTYEFSCTYENLKDIAAPVRIMIFFYENSSLDSYKSNSNIIHKAVDGNSTGVFTATFTVPSGNPYMTIRFGLCNTGGVSAGGSSVRLSGICVRDVTNFADNPVKDNVTKPNTLSANAKPENNYTVSSFPTLTRTGYTFLGWSRTRGTDGNGLFTDKVDSYTFTNEEISAGTNRTLYPIWGPNIVVARFNTGISSADSFTQDFYFGKSQSIAPVNDPVFTVSYYDGDSKYNLDQTVTATLLGWSDTQNGDVKYSPIQSITNPNGLIGNSNNKNDPNLVTTDFYSKWSSDASVKTHFVQKNNHVLVGWSETKDSSTAEYSVGSLISPSKDMNLYAIWVSLDDFDKQVDIYDETYSEERKDIVSGITITADGTVERYSEIKAVGHLKYDRELLDDAIIEYKNAKSAFSDKNADSNNKLVIAIRNLESIAQAEPKENNGVVKDYLSAFEIRYVDGVKGKVEEGTYSLADMNLNHYETNVLDVALNALTDAKKVDSMLRQETINDSVVTMARAFANPQDVKTESAPLYNVYETKSAITNNGFNVQVAADETAGVSYVFTKYDENTYYCYTNALKPTIFISVDEEAGADNRVCYPTSAKYEEIVSTSGAISKAPKIKTVVDETISNGYSTYLENGLGTELLKENPNYYSTKSTIQLSPDFSTAKDRATVKYALTAHDDAYSGVEKTNKNYATTSVLSATQDKVSVKKDDASQASESTVPELTIIFNYHKGNVDANGVEVEGDKWIKQYHLARTSGGANNWEYGKVNDTVYTLDDPTYGQTGFGSFTYTFDVGSTTDIANCVLETNDLERVKEIVAANYAEISSVPFDGAQELWKWATDPADGVWKYMKTHEAGTGLGYQIWPSGWSFNYYPKSNAYTYVHIVDRWGNAVDKIIQVPNLDASPTQLHTSSTGTVDVVEVGGSGIETISFSTQSFNIIADENSVFDGETYTTTGNTIKVYTGEANKKYTLEANDVATNKTTENVTTDADGYLTITVEDKAFDTQSGAYTFTLNGIEINLYAEVERNIISSEDVSVEEGKTAVVEIVTTDKVTSVQLVSEESGSTSTATTYTEDGDGNRVWVINKKKTTGEFEYKVRYKIGGGWLTEGNVVKVTVTKPDFFIGAVTEVNYTPSTSTRNEFMFTVTGRPDKIQVIEPDGGTRTYDRYHVNVVIVSYDENGNVVGAMSKNLSYEVWTIEMNVPVGIELTAVAKYGREWSRNEPCKYTVVLATPEFDDAVYSMSLAATEGNQGKVSTTVVTGLDVSGVKFVMDNNTTATYYNSTEADGKLTYVGDAWINHSGDNIIIVKIRVNNVWLNAGELNYYAIL